jgi:hypothetical protein
VLSEGYMTAFPAMLKGIALSHYYDSNLAARDFSSIYTHLRNYFEGLEYYRKNLTEWNAISFQGIISENPDKTTSQCLQVLIDKLCRQQHAIHPQLRNPLMLTNKLVMACQGILAYRSALTNPSEDLASLVNNLQSAIVV